MSKKSDKLTPRQRWTTNFERAVVKAMPEMAGKIDWNTASNFYNEHMISDDAAARYIARLQAEAEEGEL